MNQPTPEEWYAFHFGRSFASGPEFKPDQLFGGSFRDCAVMFADFCSFTSFTRATENIKVMESLLTSFYTQARKIIHKHSGMLYQIVGDSVVSVWGLRPTSSGAVRSILDTAAELVGMTAQVAEEWQSHIDLFIEPKGLRLGLSKGSVMVIRRDNVYPGLLLFGNPINLASRLQAVAQPNQLVCANAAYKDIEEAGLSAKFEPYRDASSDGYVDAKNFGPLKAWVLDLGKKA